MSSSNVHQLMWPKCSWLLIRPLSSVEQIQSNPKRFRSIPGHQQRAIRQFAEWSYWMAPIQTPQLPFDSYTIDVASWLTWTPGTHLDRFHPQLSFAIEYQFDQLTLKMYRLLTYHPVWRCSSQNFRMQIDRNHRMAALMHRLNWVYAMQLWCNRLLNTNLCL